MPTLKSNGIEIYYEVHGAGEPLLMIMGLGANVTAWERQIPALSEQYRVIAFDNRGAGRSEKPNEPYTMPQMARDAAGVLDALGLDTAHVFGMSLGGMIAQEFVLAFPERVRKLILGGTMAGGPKAVIAGAEIAQFFLAVRSLPLERQIEEGMSLLYSDGFLDANKAQLVERALANAHLIAPQHALIRQFMAVTGFNVFDRLGAIGAPTLVLSGTHDKIVPNENQHLLAEHIQGAKLVEFEGAGHGFLVECADHVNRAVLQFLGEHARSPLSAK